MALYHFSVRNVSRGKGQMVVASAAYISGQRIFDSYYNKIHDYTSKSGVIFTEILTPEYVPERLTDRETLWNEVEHVERNNKAQLAYSFDIALQNELTLEENIRLAKEFCQAQSGEGWLSGGFCDGILQCHISGSCQDANRGGRRRQEQYLPRPVP